VRRLLVLASAAACAGAIGIAPVAAGPSGDVARFCDLNFEVSQLFNRAPDEDASDEEIQEFQQELYALLDEAASIAPPEIAAQVSSAVAALRADLNAAFDDPAVQEASQAIDQWAVANCGYQTADVTGLEYEFDGIPKTLQTGKTAFNFTNEGAELHELIVFRIKTDTPLKKLLRLPDRKVEKQVQEIGATFALQGESGVAYLDLKKPGRYAALCFIPVGSIDPEEEVDGPPHTEEGMVYEFRVKR
jgi:uncharacterized cupredoxin-like copper-binding protein